MRIRQIKPDYWRDKTLAGMEDAIRLFYIGLWMQADDDGYLAFDVDRIAADLYPYRGVAARERFVGSAILRLADSGHVKVLECNLHVVVPGLPKHQVIASTRRVVRTHGEHNAQCLHNDDPSQHTAIQEGTVGNGRVGDGTESSHASARESAVDAANHIIADPKSSEPAKKAARKALEKMT